jgi:hypothetical protein
VERCFRDYKPITASTLPACSLKPLGLIYSSARAAKFLHGKQTFFRLYFSEMNFASLLLLFGKKGFETVVDPFILK